MAARPWATRRGTVFFDDAAGAATLSRAVKAGEIRRLARSLYTADLASSPEELVRQNRWHIVARFVPDALIADRSAATAGTVLDGRLFVVSNARARALELPGLVVMPRPGPGPLEDDPVWAQGLRVSSPARTLVDNLALSHGRGGRVARTLSRAELADWVTRQSQLLGRDRMNRIRDRAKELALFFGHAERADEIDDLVGAALRTRPAPLRNASALLAARAEGRDWDPDRVQRFDELARALSALADDIPEAIPAPDRDWATMLPFYEAYFSNFIEGTEFTVEEAEEIIATGVVPEERPEDAHDILGTHRVVSDPDERGAVPAAPDEFLDVLVRRHRLIMEGRPQVRPGLLKERPNQAGAYVFVAPELVEGTLFEGFTRLLALTAPFARALYMMFLVSEVHPFDDGNGRVARAMMNAEFTAAEQSRVVIPIVWRNEYQRGLRLLSRDGRTNVYVRTMAHAWQWTAAVPWDDPVAARTVLDATNAFLDSTEAEETGRQLLLPADLAPDGA